MNKTLLINKRVLVVEDNAINQLVVKHTLAKLGAVPEISGDGEDAIEKLRVKEYDFVLMDIQMPSMNGYETTQFIRHQLKNNIPIIAMTALALKGEDEVCFAAGMNGYVSKPFTLDSLYAAINKVINLPQQPAISNPHILSGQGISVDCSMLYQIAQEEEGYITSMIHTFLENMPVTLKNMEDSAAIRDWDSVFKSAHYAKSSLSVIKIKVMFDTVENIAHNAKHRIDVESIDTLIGLLKERFEKASYILLEKFGIAA